MNAGSADNFYRNDLFTFVDHDADGRVSLFVQGLDGYIRQYDPPAVQTPGVAPVFTLLDTDFAGSVHPDDEVTTPRDSPSSI